MTAINPTKMAGLKGGKHLPAWGGVQPNAGQLAGRKDFPYIALMITSKLTSKAQTTVPQAVRTALGLREGDELAYLIDGDRVVLSKATVRAPVDNPFALFSEWDSEEDRQAYADL